MKPVTRAIIRQQQHKDEVLHYSLEVPIDLIFFQGHFEELAILPGVVQIQWACQLAEPLIGVGFSRNIEKLKFTHPIFPGDLINLQLSLKPNNKLYFKFSDNEKVCSQGTLCYEPT